MGIMFVAMYFLIIRPQKKKQKEAQEMRDAGGSSLITCPDCGSEVSSDAASCPRCGRPLNTSRKITLTRTKKMTGAGETQNIYINEILVGALRNNQTITVYEPCNIPLSIVACNSANSAHTSNILSVPPGAGEVNILVEVAVVRSRLSLV